MESGDFFANAAARIVAGESAAPILEQLGDPDPRGVEALALAVGHPDLAPLAARWLPELLASARPAAGARQLTELAESARGGLGRALAPDSLTLVARVVGASPFLARALAQQPEWTDALVGETPAPPDTREPDPDWEAIRAHKYRGLLHVVARDLSGRPFEQSLRELSDLADGCLAAGLRRAADESKARPPALFALGKLGGSELNLSSDVDLLFLFDVAEGEDEIDQREAASRLIRILKTGLEERTETGFAYRVDLDLRPEGRTGTLANSVEAALSYYETFGAEWERQMLIRLRAVAGPDEPGRAFAREIAPFVYRTLIDPSAIDSVRDMKMRIESERRSKGVDLEVELKEGPGGIRDVEFLVQALQLLLGGRDVSLRTGNVLDALAALGESGTLRPEVVQSLHDAYLWLRRAEHGVQMAEERQTHRFPRGARDQIELARRMSYREPSGEDARNRLLDDWTRVRAEVRAHFESLVLRQADDE